MSFVFGVIAFSSLAGSRLNVSGSMSTKIVRAPRRATAPAVEKNEYGDVTTSSPGPMPSAIMTASCASVPEDIPIACFAPV